MATHNSRHGFFLPALLITLLVSASVPVSAQFYDAEENPRNKLGLRVGLSVSTINGTALQNPALLRGFAGGFYWRTRLAKHFHLQTEACVAYRGSTYNNGEDAYDKVLLLYSDLPVMLMIDVGGNQKNNVVVGAVGSALLRSSMYVDNDPTPKHYGLMVKPVDVLALAGYHYSLENVGFMLTGKMSLINVNDRFNYPDVKPAQNPSGTMYNFAIELSVLF